MISLCYSVMIIVSGCFRDPYESIRCNSRRIADNSTTSQGWFPIDPSV